MAFVHAETPTVSRGHLTVLNDKKEVNMGLMKRDTIAEAPLLLLNDGTDSVSVISVFSDCNCTVLSYPKEPLAPGDTMNINVRFNSGGRIPGAFKKLLRIRSTASNGLEVAFVVGTVARPTRKN